MISIHNVKEILIISGLSAFFLYALKIMNMTKNSAKYLIIALFALILKEWFI